MHKLYSCICSIATDWELLLAKSQVYIIVEPFLTAGSLLLFFSICSKHCIGAITHQQDVTWKSCHRTRGNWRASGIDVNLQWWSGCLRHWGRLMPQAMWHRLEVMNVYTMQTCRNEVYTFKGVVCAAQKTMCFLAAQGSLSWLHWFNQTRVEYSWFLLWCQVDINTEPGAILEWKCYTHPINLDTGL